MTKLYIVLAVSGEYECYTERMVKAYRSEARALNHAATASELSRAYEVVRDEYPDDVYPESLTALDPDFSRGCGHGVSYQIASVDLADDGE